MGARERGRGVYWGGGEERMYVLTLKKRRKLQHSQTFTTFDMFWVFNQLKLATKTENCMPRMISLCLELILEHLLFL